MMMCLKEVKNYKGNDNDGDDVGDEHVDNKGVKNHGDDNDTNANYRDDDIGDGIYIMYHIEPSHVVL